MQSLLNSQKYVCGVYACVDTDACVLLMRMGKLTCMCVCVDWSLFVDAVVCQCGRVCERALLTEKLCMFTQHVNSDKWTVPSPYEKGGLSFGLAPPPCKQNDATKNVHNLN